MPRPDLDLGSTDDRRWKLDRHVPVAFIIGLVIQAAGIVWWGSQIQSKQEDHERRISLQESAKIIERMAVLEEQLRASKELQGTMNYKLDRLLEYTLNGLPNSNRSRSGQDVP